ncbi:MAG: BamA/TamA family outer membrane protein [Phycisphaerae bacterium]|nr:BamA/TamA family outer membrane protein [Gemmatimonadaceae bacterium]
MSLRSPRALRLVCLLASLLAATHSAHGQGSPSRGKRCANAERVQSIDFAGTPKFNSVVMASLIVNESPDFFSRIIGRATFLCVDTLEVQRDALRLAVLHRQHGWFLANVAPRYERRRDGVKLTFDITSGPEAQVDSVLVTGLPPVEEGARDYGAPLLGLKGQRFDRVRVQALVDTAVERLKNAGYARAVAPTSVFAIDTASATDSSAARVQLAFAFTPGARLRVGGVHVRIQGVGERRTVDSADIMSLMRLRAGQRYRANNIIDAQRDLYRTDAFRLVLIDTIAPRAGSADSLIDLQVTVAEARTRYARAGAGWATQDCGRIQARMQDRAFLSPGRRAEISMRASKLGVGAPFDFAERLCSGLVRRDPFSERVNYYVGSTITNTRFWGRPFSPTFSVYSERRGEPLAYLRETSIGALFELSSTKWRRTVVTPGVQYERGRTISDPVVSCTRFGLCQPQDEKVSLFGRAVSVFNTSLYHDRANDAVNPSAGSRYRAQVRAGLTSATTRQNISFYRGTGEVSAYRQFFGGIFATRFQVARVFAPNAPLVNGVPLLPQQERLFAGGQSSVRGFAQNLLGPLVYAFKDSVQDVRVVQRDGQSFLEVFDSTARVHLVVPRGGTALFVGNLEWRRRITWPTDKLQIALFADAGTVFETNAQQFQWRDVRVTPGFGVRLDTPLGPFRVDLGYNPYEQRAGRALLFTGSSTTGAITGAIRCVTPGNTIALGPAGQGELDLSKCPETYRPPARGVLGRLVFHFSLGQAF